MFVFFAWGQSLIAQGYITSAGIRLGSGIGFTLQQQLLEHTTIEGILQSDLGTGDISLTGLLEQHYPIVTKNLNIYVGGGVHKGWIMKRNRELDYQNPYGVSLIVGAELRLGRLLISYDFKPAINVHGGDRVFEPQTALSLRYVFIKAKKKKINWKFWEED